jgi:hypothetical protein
MDLGAPRPALGRCYPLFSRSSRRPDATGKPTHSNGEDWEAEQHANIVWKCFLGDDSIARPSSSWAGSDGSEEAGVDRFQA